MSDMNTINIEEASNYVEKAIDAKVPAMLWGAPGIGKSSIIKQIAVERGWSLKDIRLTQVEPTDLRGIPFPNHEIKRAQWYLPTFWPNRATEAGIRKVVGQDGSVKKVPYDVGECPDGPGIVFLDEIEKAPVSVKNASLELVLDRRLGDYQLPDDWSIVCAGNREEDGAFSAPTGAALDNRMIHYHISANLEQWAKWARINDVAEDVIGFIHFRPDLLYKRDDGGAEHAFPSPRSWEMASIMLNTASSDKERKHMVRAAVGSGAAIEFTAWRKIYKSVDPKAILDGQMVEDFTEKDQGFKFAITLAVAFYLNKRKKNIAGIEANVVKFLHALSPELRVVFLKQQRNHTLEKMVQSPEFKEFVQECMSIVC